MDTIIESMTTQEANRLAELETRIEVGLQTVMEVGRALAEIRDGKLYRTTTKTFEDYCLKRWNISRPNAYRMIEAAGVVKNLSPMGDILPTNERQARPLTRLKPEAQRKVWTEVVETAPEGKVTAAHVERVVTAYEKGEDNKVPEPVPVNVTDTEIYKRRASLHKKCFDLLNKAMDTGYSENECTEFMEELRDTVTEYRNEMRGE